MKVSSVKINDAAVQSEEGVWQADLPELGNMRFLVRGLNNKQYRLKFEAMVRALPPSKKKNGAIDPVERDRLTGLCLLEHALLNWDNVEGDVEGELQPYTKELAKLYLTDPDYQKIRDGVFVAASRVGEAVEEDAAGTAKNLKLPSTTL